MLELDAEERDELFRLPEVRLVRARGRVRVGPRARARVRARARLFRLPEVRSSGSGSE